MLFSMPDADSDEEMASETSSFIICQNCGERLRPAMIRCRSCGTVIPRILSSAQSNKPAARQPGFNTEDSIVEDVLKQAPALNERSPSPVMVELSAESPRENPSNPSKQKPINAGKASPGGNSDAEDGFVCYPCRCGKQLRARAQWVGKSLKCPGCGKNCIVRRAVSKAFRQIESPNGAGTFSDDEEYFDEIPWRPFAASFRDFLVGLLPDALVGFLWPASGTGKIAVSLTFAGLVAGLILFQLNGSSINGATATGSSLMRGGVSSIAFSEDGTELAVTRSFGMVEVWDTSESTIKTEANLGICTGVVFHKDPGDLILAQGPNLKLWNSRTEKTPTRTFKKHDKPIFFLDSSADRRLLFTRSLEGILTIWNLEDLQPVNSKPIRIPHVQGAPFSFSQDGKWFARGGQKGEVILLQLPGVKLVGTFKVSLSSITSIAFSPDNKKMAVGTASGKISLYDLDSKKKDFELEGELTPTMLKFHPDSRRLASVGGTKIELWDLETREAIAVADTGAESYNSAVFSQDGKRLAVAGEDDLLIWIFNTESGKLVSTLDVTL